MSPARRLRSSGGQQPGVGGVVRRADQTEASEQDLAGQVDEPAVLIAFQDAVMAMVESSHDSAVTVDRSLVDQVLLAMIADAGGSDGQCLGTGRFGLQLPGGQHVALLEQQVPVFAVRQSVV